MIFSFIHLRILHSYLFFVFYLVSKVFINKPHIEKEKITLAFLLLVTL